MCEGEEKMKKRTAAALIVDSFVLLHDVSEHR